VEYSNSAAARTLSEHPLALSATQSAIHLKVVCVSAKGAAFNPEPGGNVPGGYGGPNASAESAIHHEREFDWLALLKRAFSACLHDNSNSWGDAPGSSWHGGAPLAL